MKIQVTLACLLLTAVSALAQTATIQFHREGNNVIVTQNGSSQTVAASGDNDFIVPVPNATPAPAPQPVAPAPAPSTPTITAAPATPATVPVHSKPIRPRQENSSVPAVSQPSIIQYAPERIGNGGVIISPSTLPNDTLPKLPVSDMAQGSTSYPTSQPPSPVKTSVSSPSPSEMALTAAERRELNLYRTMLASPLHLTVENGAVTVKWNSAHGTVTIPDSHEIDIKLDRVIQAPPR